MRNIETSLQEPGIAIPDFTVPLANYILLKKIAVIASRLFDFSKSVYIIADVA